MTKLIVAFRNFAKVPTNKTHFIPSTLFLRVLTTFDATTRASNRQEYDPLFCIRYERSRDHVPTASSTDEMQVKRSTVVRSLTFFGRLNQKRPLSIQINIWDSDREFNQILKLYRIASVNGSLVERNRESRSARISPVPVRFNPTII